MENRVVDLSILQSAIAFCHVQGMIADNKEIIIYIEEKRNKASGTA